MLVVLLAALSSATWYNIGLVVVVACTTIMAVVAYRTWVEAHEDVEPVSTGELLESFERARAAGDLDDEEYDRVRRRLNQSDTAPDAEPKQDAG
ncbi:MAG: hypothetical protein U0790_21725 [Isosphaeraceae bacterium]